MSLGEHIKRTVALAPAVMLARLGMVVMITVDTAMVGRAGAAALAALAISMPPQIIVLTISTGLLTGTVVLTAQADGAGEASRAGVILKYALLVGLITGLLFSALSRVPDPTISLLVAVPCLAWSMTRLLRSRRRWMDPVGRARIVTTVAA